MPRRNDIAKILVIGSGPIVIGQSAEFDYSGTQACKALKAEGYEVVLVNSNPASIMTDPEVADRTYIEPLNAAYLEEILRVEVALLDPDGLGRGRKFAMLPTVGGQTALNLAVDLADMSQSQPVVECLPIWGVLGRIHGRQRGPPKRSHGFFENSGRENLRIHINGANRIPAHGAETALFAVTRRGQNVRKRDARESNRGTPLAGQQALPADHGSGRMQPHGNFSNRIIVCINLGRVVRMTEHHVRVILEIACRRNDICSRVRGCHSVDPFPAERSSRAARPGRRSIAISNRIVDNGLIVSTMRGAFGIGYFLCVPQQGQLPPSKIDRADNSYKLSGLALGPSD